MLYSLSQQEKLIFSCAAALLIAAGGRSAAPSPVFFYSNTSVSHISLSYSLYKGDTVRSVARDTPAIAKTGAETRDFPLSDYIHRERNGDLVISIAGVLSNSYRVRFFEGNVFLFEIRRIRDPLLIIEKFNFQHAGQFQYELYRENVLIERNTFYIRRE